MLALSLLAAIALDLNDEVQEIVVAVAVIDAHDEVGQVFLWRGAQEMRHLEAEALVFDVGADAFVSLGGAAELCLLSLSQTTQLTWQWRRSVCHSAFFEVSNRI